MRVLSFVVVAGASLLRQRLEVSNSTADEDEPEPQPYTEGVYTQCNPGPLKATAKACTEFECVTYLTRQCTPVCDGTCEYEWCEKTCHQMKNDYGSCNKLLCPPGEAALEKGADLLEIAHDAHTTAQQRQ
mmetsp:Transcript_38217/g.91882  ORF Transcript_38217/g.91882 Transcript_38217/m.91882 type:complete len:130 (+) Transcript_38217:78-467(+)